MTKFKVTMSSVDDVKKLCNFACGCTGNIDALSGHHVVDAKSIMGLFSLDLSREVVLQIYNSTDSDYLKNALEVSRIQFSQA